MSNTRNVLGSASLLISDNTTGEAFVSFAGTTLKALISLTPAKESDSGKAASAAAQTFRETTLSLGIGGNLGGTEGRVFGNEQPFASISGSQLYWKLAVQRVGSENLVHLFIYKLGR